MCALFPAFYPNYGWPLDNNIQLQQQSLMFEGNCALETFLDDRLHPESDQSPSSPTNESHLKITKKLNHNASERCRRKKMNSLYASLRSLLPAHDQSKKLSIPATISWVLKYIPQLQDQVNKLIRKKDELMLRVSRESGVRNEQKETKKTKTAVTRSFSTVSATKLSDTEIMVQISSTVAHPNNISNVLAASEEEGFCLMNASHFMSVGGRIFHNLHFEVEVRGEVDCEALCDRFLRLYERDEISLG